ncbi:uncharacterized protein PRCAT00005934001 [Priceomyces carsonii]|uniref:uncharacterized protein n=1 Tax=Priceomyces carsonii TaxID=28549 RepID=UPI002ED89901|nr:unnamed protein product [Priceomyces carsonii]
MVEGGDIIIDSSARSKDLGKPKTLNVFDNALQSWAEIDLPALQKKLDEQGLSLKDEQKSSLLSRKNLAAKTKEFKKLPDSQKLEGFKSLLKLYQNEIDALTNKKKDAESYFFGIYRIIAEAPDPRPLLELSLDAVAEISDLDDLRRDVTRLNEELSKKADYEQLKQRLLQNEQRSAETLSSKLVAKEEEFKALIDEKESNWKEREKSFQNQIKEAQRKIEELRTSKEVTELQLNSQQSQSNSLSSAEVVAELEIVSRDAESSKKRVFELEKRNEQLRRDLSNSQNDATITSLKAEYTKKISELEGENALLLAQFENHKKDLKDTSKQSLYKIESLNREILQLSFEIKKLKEKLEKSIDYEEIKHELQLLRQIEFGNEEDINDGAIDSVILQKNKSLTKELADLRSQHDDHVSKIENLNAEATNIKQELEKSRALNIKLENDMADVREYSNSGKFNDTSSIISGMSKVTRGVRNGTAGPNSSSDETSILPIITKQRDRFRDRNNELEDELKKQYTIVSDLKRNVNALKRDNEELYERTRYLASMKNNLDHNNASRQLATRKFQPKSNIDESNPYREVYESRLHPIEQFRLREQERISSKLSPLERLFISGTRAILATRTTRMLFLFYCIGLHCIVVFMTIYSMSLSTSLIPEVGLNSSTGGVAGGGALAAEPGVAAQPDSPNI